MTLIDPRGRLLGIVNVLDALIVLVAVGVVAVAPVALRTAERRSPNITDVSPRNLIAGERTRVRLSGTDFPTNLKAFVPKTGRPFFLADKDGSQVAPVLASSPELAEIEMPDLIPGVYDLYLFQRDRQVVFHPAVFHVESPTLPRGTLMLKVRFLVPPESLHLLRVGDQDQFQLRRPTNPTTEGAVVRAVTPVPGVTQVLEMHLVDDDTRWIGERISKQSVDVTLEVPVLDFGHGAYGYKETPLSVGALFTLTTDRYRFRGAIAASSGITWLAAGTPPLK
jgi:hypothetical protein